MTKVIIIGAGISGLSCAYDLASHGYKVEIYEASDTFGGQAKSIKTKTCYTPYAWRIWSNFYYNFLDISKHIPFEGGTIRDSLIKISSYTHKQDIGRNISGDSVFERSNFPSTASYNNVILKMCHAILFSDERLQDNDITFYEYIDPQDQATINFVDEFVGPILGVEARRATLFSVIKGWQITYFSPSIANGFSDKEIYVANGPYSEVLFNPWVKYLQKKGVIIHTNSRVTDLHYDISSNKIVSMDTNTTGRVEGDEFVICIDQTSLNKLLRTNKNLMKIPMLSKSTELMHHGNNLWFGMVLHFSEKFNPPFGTGCTQDQPWKIVLENFSASWKEKYIKSCNMAEIIQVSVLDLVPGYNGKMLKDCSVEEAIKETFDQLRKSELIIGLKTVSGKHILDTLVGYDVWPDWINGPDGKIQNKEGQYKLSINPKCLDLMPNIKTPVNNLFFGSVIARGDAPMVSMEIACSNGRRAAVAISEKYNTPVPHVFSHEGFLPVVLAPFRKIDSLLYSFGIKANMIVITISLVLIVIIFLIVIIVLIIKKLRNKPKLN